MPFTIHYSSSQTHRHTEGHDWKHSYFKRRYCSQKATVGPLPSHLSWNLYSEMNSSFSSNDAGLLVGVWVGGGEMGGWVFILIHLTPAFWLLIIPPVLCKPKFALFRLACPCHLICHRKYFSISENLKNIQHLNNARLLQKIQDFLWDIFSSRFVVEMCLKDVLLSPLISFCSSISPLLYN